MKALIQTGSSLSACGHAQAGGRVPVPLKSDFLSMARFTVGIDAEWSDEKPGGLANYTPSYEGGNDACQPGEVAISDLLARSPSWKSLRRPTPW